MHKSIIDEALMKARDLVGHTKSASAVPDLVKEAEDLAGALEFISMAAVDDGTAAGSHGRSLLTDFFKDAAAGGPAESVTSSGGTQGQPPASGKTHIPVGTPGGTAPGESLAPTGKMDRDMMAQTGKNAGAVTLFDLIAGDVEKMAAQPGQGPSESLGGQNTAAPLSKNENSNIHLLRSNTAPVAATKRQAKMPTRDRLKRAWNHASDTTSDATAKAVWPQAASKGSIKVAKDEPKGGKPRGGAWNPKNWSKKDKRVAGWSAAPVWPLSSLAADKGKQLRTAGGSLVGGVVGSRAGRAVGGAVGGAIGKAVGNAEAGKAIGKAVGTYGSGIAGAAYGGGVAHATGKADPSKKQQGSAEKKGSAAEWGQVFDAMLDGQAGAEAQAFARHIDDAQI